MMWHKSIFCMVVLVVLLAGCQPVSVEEAQAQLCADLTEFKSAMAAVEALTLESTGDEAEAALQAADDAWDAVRSSAYAVSDAEYENLEQAYEDLDDAVRDIEGDDTLQDAAASLQDEVANVNAAYDAFFDLGCAE